MEQNQQNTWQTFIEKLGTHLDTPLSPKELKKILKISDKVFPTTASILNHYQNKFSKETNQNSRSKWHTKDKLLLVWCVVKLHENDQRTIINPTQNDWDYLSQVLGVKAQLLNLKWLSLLKTTLKDAPWTEEEDQILLEIVKQKEFKKNWTEIAMIFNKKIETTSITRYAKQIRERWNNYLDPQLKRNNWDNKERYQLFILVKCHGKKWSKISQKLVGRTENQVKNHYHSVIKFIQKNISLELTESDITDIMVMEQDISLEGLVGKYKHLKTDIKIQKDLELEKAASYPVAIKYVKIQQNSTSTELKCDNQQNVKIEQEMIERKSQSSTQIPTISQLSPSQPSLTPQVQSVPQINLSQVVFQHLPIDKSSQSQQCPVNVYQTDISPAQFQQAAFWTNWQKVQQMAWASYVNNFSLTMSNQIQPNLTMPLEKNPSFLLGQNLQINLNKAQSEKI